MRTGGRDTFGLRPIRMEKDFIKYPHGSCLVRMGNTWVLCSATVDESIPPFLEKRGKGWITAEYAMIPGATHSRSRRESTTGRPNGRSQEIQRLIGRSLRASLDLSILGERTVTLDCDVLQADGGTRIASINGAYVAMALALSRLKTMRVLNALPIKAPVAAVSVAMKGGEILVDPDYVEDSSCDVDMNIVMLEGGQIVEMQGTAEGKPFSTEDSQRMLKAASAAIQRIIEVQKAILKEAGA